MAAESFDQIDLQFGDRRKISEVISTGWALRGQLPYTSGSTDRRLPRRNLGGHNQMPSARERQRCGFLSSGDRKIWTRREPASGNL